MKNNNDIMRAKAAAALKKAGITDFENVALTDNRPGIMVHHNYNGMYPTDGARRISAAAGRVAEKLNLKFESRGYYTATLIYC